MATEKLHFEIDINAPAEKVWDVMLELETYKEWTKAFDETSSFIGTWEKGTKMKFVSSKTGEGMSSIVAENIPGKFISIQHVGMIKADGTEDTTSDLVKMWTPAFENYTFEEKDGGTLLKIDIDVAQEMKDEFSKMWPEALQKLKEISEK